MKVSRILVAFAMVAILATSASALELSFSGSGPSGTDPLGHAWDVKDLGGGTTWGIPGLGDGNQTWLGKDWISDFHIEFFGLPEDVQIIAGPAGFLGTRFARATGSGFPEWNEAIDGLKVDFWAPDYIDDRVNPGDEFFVNVVFNTSLSDEVIRGMSFYASYTMTPEPSSIILAGLGLAGLGLAVRRRRRSA